MRLLVVVMALAVVGFRAERAEANDSYVTEPPLARGVAGLDIYAGSPLGRGDGVLRGGGTDVFAGYAWDGGWSLVGLAGVGWWSATPGVLPNSHPTVFEGYAGLGPRYAFGDRDLCPFVQLVLLGELVRTQRADDSVAIAASLALGARLRTAAWEGWMGVEARRIRGTPVVPDGPGLDLTRIAFIVGVGFDLGVR